MKALTKTARSSTRPEEGKRPKPVLFCSRCGQPSQEPVGRFERPGRERVCRLCGMGLMLTASPEALPPGATAFLIVTFELCVSAVSDAGEKIFGPERTLVDAPLLDIVTSPLGDDLLAQTVAYAAQRVSEPVVLPVRLVAQEVRERGMLAARVGTCGPPRAALVTVEPSEFGRR